jgi:hypothetical protein
VKKRMPKAAAKVVAERTDAASVSRQLWKGLLRYNRKEAGPFRYSRTVLSVRDD